MDDLSRKLEQSGRVLKRASDPGSNPGGAIMNRKLVLFDIDKTLVDRKKGDTEKFHYAIEKVYGIRGEKIITHGMTDQQIVIEILKKEGFSERAIKSKIEECKAALIEYYKENKNSYEYTVFDGVFELLNQFNKNKILTGLVTGNLEEIARMKLEKVKLNKFFKIGGFGSDAIQRSDLVRIAISRAKKEFGFKADNNVFVIGDSPKDIEAGKEAGVKTIGVATGVYSEIALKRSKPDYTLPNLKNTQKILGIIMG